MRTGYRCVCSCALTLQRALLLGLIPHTDQMTRKQSSRVPSVQLKGKGVLSTFLILCQKLAKTFIADSSSLCIFSASLYTKICSVPVSGTICCHRSDWWSQKSKWCLCIHPSAVSQVEQKTIKSQISIGTTDSC